MIPIGSFTASFNSAGRELNVALVTDRGRYAPGETVTVDVRTTNQAASRFPPPSCCEPWTRSCSRSGRPTTPICWGACTLQVGAGVLWTHASHPLPLGNRSGEGGDTTGGGGDGRSEFVDSLLFRQVPTDAQGRARISFKLSDDLTSWHLSAAAMTSVPEAGSASILVPVGLPFFVEATIAPEYLVADQPVIRLQTYGSGLRNGDPVTFTITSKTLGLPKTTVRGTAFEEIDFPLPKLSVGEHTITIAASRDGGGAAGLSDTLTRRFTVVQSRLVETMTAFSVLTGGPAPAGGAGFTTYVFSDAGRGRYVPLLEELAGSGGPRVDQALAAAMARDLLIAEFAVDPASLPPATFDPDPYQAGGVALLPYASEDLRLTVLAALLAPDRFRRDGLGEALLTAVRSTASTREQRVLRHRRARGPGRTGPGRSPGLRGRSGAHDPRATLRRPGSRRARRQHDGAGHRARPPHGLRAAPRTVDSAAGRRVTGRHGRSDVAPRARCRRDRGSDRE